jgi:hypothetical protein
MNIRRYRSELAIGEPIAKATRKFPRVMAGAEQKQRRWRNWLYWKNVGAEISGRADGTRQDGLHIIHGYVP